MRLSLAATVGVLFGLVLILPGCGDRRAPAASTEAAHSPDAKLGVSSAIRICQARLHDFLGSMDELRRKLAVGLSYGTYLREVKGVQVEYDRVQVDRLGLACLLRAGTPAERALNLYIAAANTWGNCLTSPPCSSESVEPKLQHKWALASDRLSSAQGPRPGNGRN